MQSIHHEKEQEPKVELRISFSEALETERVRYTLNKLPWFKEQGYNVKFPKAIQEDANRGSTIDDAVIQAAVKGEFDETPYREQSEKLIKEWVENEPSFIANLKTLGLPLPKEYSIIFTRYGVGGSYNPPNKVIINIASERSTFLEIVMHEIVHLAIEQLIQEYSIDHWTKERVVDLTMSKFLNTRTAQRNPEHVEEIETIYDEYYPNITMIVQKIHAL